MDRLDRAGQLWLYRTKPKEDELFSSWLVRLASGLAIRLQTFSTQVLGLHAGCWTGDIDRQPNVRALACLCDGTAVPLERAQAIGLASYEGRLWERYQSRGPMPWLTPIGRHGRRHEMHGQQYCRQCLESDATPYFRRRWRLAFNVTCEHHGSFLEDECPRCHAPVEFHTGDFGRKLLEFECPITRCGVCGSDFREWHPGADRHAPSYLLDFQGALTKVLDQGHNDCLPGANLYSHLFFEGLQHLVQLMCSRGRFHRVREWLLSRSGQLNLEIDLERRWHKFEALRVGDRALILSLLYQLIQDWPHAFVEACRTSRVSSSYILIYGHDLPFWLSSEVEWYLDDRDYAPAAEERMAVECFLDKHGLSVNRNTVNWWLGVSSVSALLRRQPTRERWNPRGPRKRKH